MAAEAAADDPQAYRGDGGVVDTGRARSSTPTNVQASPNASQAIGQPNSMTAEASRIAAPIGRSRRPDQHEADQDAADERDRLRGHRARAVPPSRRLPPSTPPPMRCGRRGRQSPRSSPPSADVAPSRPAANDRNEPGRDGDDRQRKDVDEVAGPVRRRWLADHRDPGDRPRATAQEGSGRGQSRFGVEAGIDGTPSKIQPGTWPEIGLLEDRQRPRPRSGRASDAG